MDPTFKVEPRRRVVVGWRQLARRVAEIRARQRPTPVPLPKRER
jgi:hypothetical protein